MRDESSVYRIGKAGTILAPDAARQRNLTSSINDPARQTRYQQRLSTPHYFAQVRGKRYSELGKSRQRMAWNMSVARR
jgi:hypothetical protein